jgi:hypothetical protein
MALTAEDMEMLGSFIDQKLISVVGDVKEAAKAAEGSKGSVDAANSTEHAPMYWVHLADGSVILSTDSGSTHMDVDGDSVQVIGRYLKGA